ncbi:hypothetical protein NDU88_006140 [Pleurodeles waltl]|uniref:Uncharacterized protein n=1 Tax=Pleurodeles waltl TaxID=8319 RepID=A0AAV7LN66_PLEWA|nr:hypothetical protein NDU88_006140 [Pleurodeles waltl]
MVDWGPPSTNEPRRPGSPRTHGAYEGAEGELGRGCLPLSPLHLSRFYTPVGRYWNITLAKVIGSYLLQAHLAMRHHTSHEQDWSPSQGLGLIATGLGGGVSDADGPTGSPAPVRHV